MRTVHVTEDEARCIQRQNKNLKVFFKEFMSENVKVKKVELDEDDYVNPLSAYKSLHKAVGYLGLPIKVKYKKGELYLIRRDI